MRNFLSHEYVKSSHAIFNNAHAIRALLMRTFKIYMRFIMLTCDVILSHPLNNTSHAMLFYRMRVIILRM